jgi:hypothetical protein
MMLPGRLRKKRGLEVLELWDCHSSLSPIHPTRCHDHLLVGGKISNLKKITKSGQIESPRESNLGPYLARESSGGANCWLRILQCHMIILGNERVFLFLLGIS